jgi:Immunoglobulin-like domain of bacterial spore germination/Sporulation and spore germination
MNDEQLRDLADRVVAMAPEPPPFPEGITVTPAEPPRRWTPVAIVVVAAALVIAVVAVPIILISRGPQTAVAPSTSTPTTVAPTTQPTFPTTLPPTTSPAPATTVPVTTTLPEELGTVERPAVVYLAQTPGNSLAGNPAVVAIATTVVTAAPELDSDGTALIAASLQLLTRPDLVVPDGWQNLIPDGVYVQSVSSDDAGHTLVVDMNDRFLEGTAGLLGDITMLNQLVYTATQLGAGGVRFTVDGQPIEAYGSEGMVLSDPVTRDTFLDELSSIVITEPLVLEGDELPRVVGRANVFEATVSLQIVDAGQVVYEDFTTATCGTGCWGDFAFTLDTPALTPGSQVRVFWSSPKDGSAVDVVAVPAAGSWDMVPGD